MIRIENMSMQLDIGSQACWDACLAPVRPVPLNEKTNRYLHSIERDLKSEIQDLGPDTEAAKPIWEKVSRVQQLSGVVVAAMVGGELAAREAADFLTQPQPTSVLRDDVPFPSDPFESLLKRIAS